MSLLVPMGRTGAEDVTPAVVYVSDFYAPDRNGGAELSLQTLMRAGPSPHVALRSKDVGKRALAAYADRLWVFGNHNRLNRFAMRAVTDSTVDYVVIAFDYIFCKHRSPELHRYRKGRDCQCERTARGRRVAGFLNAARRVFFMSDKQRDIHVHRLDLDPERCTTLSSVFEHSALDRIQALKNTSKSDHWVVPGSPSWIKGREPAIAWCKDRGVPHTELHGLTPDAALELLAGAHGLVSLPPGGDTCPRLVIEAKLLGCELMINENVQHADEAWFATDDLESIDAYLRATADRFWRQARP